MQNKVQGGWRDASNKKLEQTFKPTTRVFLWISHPTAQAKHSRVENHFFHFVVNVGCLSAQNRYAVFLLRKLFCWFSRILVRRVDHSLEAASVQNELPVSNYELHQSIPNYTTLHQVTSNYICVQLHLISFNYIWNALIDIDSCCRPSQTIADNCRRLQTSGSHFDSMMDNYVWW